MQTAGGTKLEYACSNRALAGGPLGKVLDGDLIEITIDPTEAAGSLHLVGTADEVKGPAWGTTELTRRPLHADLHEADRLPDDTRLWALLQSLSGGTWGGCVYDLEAIRAALGHPEAHGGFQKEIGR